ncbi:MAG: Jag N-terminal domain-containing protein [Firmicutes bacterium]|nr:Jag N-terminal domain-containing protein [Bacillota bacterium]
MEKFITATGKTIDLAIEAGLTQLSMDRDSVSVEILETPKSGFFGIGASPAKVKLTYEAPDEPAAPAPALSSASRSKPKKFVSEKPAEAANAPKVIAPAAAPMQRPTEQRANAKPTAEKPERQEKPRQPRENKPRQEKNRQPKPQQPKKEAAPAEPKVYTPAEPGSTEERIEQFVKGLLEHMGSDAVPHAMKTADESYSVDLVGENLGILIGRRGETLDAIQHLANYAVNRGQNKRVRINVDAENYRLKREESLQRLAQKVAGKVTKYRRNITLEPMNAYERHVIHATLQDYPDVTTYSTGTEPNRRIVVAYSRYKNTEFEEK